MIRLRVTNPFIRALLAAVLLLLATALPDGAEAQGVPRLVVGDSVHQVRLTTGDLYIGQVVAVEGDRITLRTVSGVVVQFEQGQVAALESARGRIVDGVFWMDDPNLTRLMFGPTGRTLPAGQGYAGVFELFFPFLSYGLTDWLTISGGTPVIPEVIGRAVYIAPKARIFRRGPLDVSAGVLALFDLQGDSDDFSSAGIFYGAGTWGDADRALTAGVGWGFAGDEVASRPLFMVGGETRTGRRLKLVTENYLISYVEEVYNYDPGESWRSGNSRSETRQVGIVSAGIRIIGERLSVDAGLGMGVGGDDSFCCLPLVNFVYNFGSR